MSAVEAEYVNTSNYNIEDTEKLIINKDILRFMNKIFDKSDKKREDFSLLFENDLLEKLNKSKKYDIKHQKFNVDKYNLLVKEDQYNQTKNIYGWRFNDNGEVINISVTKELELTKTPEEIFKIVFMDWIKRGKINYSSKSIAGQAYKALGIDLTNFIKENTNQY